MLYDIDVFGYVFGYVSKKWSVMSEEDLLADKRLANRFHETRYQTWIQNNIVELHNLYEKKICEGSSFEKFCKYTYESFLDREKRTKNKI